MTSSVGDLLREVRSHHGVSQEELAAKTGITQETISRYESGKATPTVEKLAALLGALDEELLLVVRSRRADARGKGARCLYLRR